MANTGRPTDYTEELGDEICQAVSVANKGVAHLCNENPHWPCRQTIFEWRIKHKSFGDKYTKAKQNQIETLVDDMLDIIDNTSNDTLIRQDKHGQDYEVCNNEWINRSRLRFEGRKWLAAKLAPKIYGEKTSLEDKADGALTELAAIKDIVTRCMKPMV